MTHGGTRSAHSSSLSVLKISALMWVGQIDINSWQMCTL